MFRNRGVIRSYILAWVSAGRMPGVDAHGTPGATWPWGTMLSVVSAEADAGKAAARDIAAARRARLWDTRRGYSTRCQTFAGRSEPRRTSHRWLTSPPRCDRSRM